MIAIYVLLGTAIALGLSAYSVRQAVTVDGFFAGRDGQGHAPDLWTLILSQVTTWIFARSLLNSAILGYYYGIAGTLAYAAYYLSFLTGGFFVGRLRRDGYHSVQDWLNTRFGAVGTHGYNAVVALRLLSEVFANLLVIGLIFRVVFPEFGAASIVSVIVLSVFTLIYSAWGGLRASLRTDVLQMLLFLGIFGVAFVYLILSPDFSTAAFLTADGTAGGYNGWILLLVAFLQVPSYPLHDPVMMDRGFLADERTTQKSFYWAFVISVACIIGFGFFGIHAALMQQDIANDLLGTWAVMFPAPIFAALLVSLLVSGVSTLDSALASAARLMVEEWRIAPRNLMGGRLVMVVFLILGAALTLWGNATLFDAVAVSGTASMFLTPLIVVSVLMNRHVAAWAFIVSFAAAIFGGVLYFARASAWASGFLVEGHKYEQLLAICVGVLICGTVACVFGSSRVASQDRG